MPWLPRPTRTARAEEVEPALVRRPRRALNLAGGWHPRGKARPVPAVEEAQPQPRRKSRAFPWFLAAYYPVRCGRYRVQNNAVEGYVVYVGYGAMPDFYAAPAGFGTILPVAFAVVPAAPGLTVVLWVVLRKRNKYGLESQNTQPVFIEIDDDGDEVLGEVSAPVIAGVVPVTDEYFQVRAQYPGYDTDPHPADKWRLYVGAGVAPVPGVDVPVLQGTIIGNEVVFKVGPYITGGMDYHFALTVYRTEDAVVSTAATYLFSLPADPDEPVALPGAFTIEE